MEKKEILVLGPGCYRCQKVRENAETAAKELGIEYEVIKVSDPGAIAGFGVMMTPGLIIDGTVKSSGKIPSVEEIKKMLQE